MGRAYLHHVTKKERKRLLCFVFDFRKLNQWLKRAPHPVPKIQDLLHKLEGFMHPTSLDLNMGHCHIKLDPETQKYCTIVTQWGCLSYLRLLMGVSSSADIFQERMTGHARTRIRSSLHRRCLTSVENFVPRSSF
jgi:hypothetical protein